MSKASSLTPDWQHATAKKAAVLKDFAGEIVHDLNNILTAIGGNLSLLSESLETLDADRMALLDAAVQSLRNGVSLSEKLEAFAGRLQLHPTAVEVNGVVDTALDQITGSVTHSTMLRRVRSPRSLMAFIDGRRLLEAIGNLAITVKHVAAETREPFTVLTDSVIVGEESRLPLHPGSYAYISFAFVSDVLGMQELTRAFTNPYAGIRALRHQNWNLACITGFVVQSGGHITVDRTSGQTVRVDLYLPSEKISR